MTVVSLLLFSQKLTAQCNSNLVLLFVKNDSSKVISFHPGKKMEVLTPTGNVTGKLNCVKSHRIRLNNAWVELQNIQLIIDPNEPFRWNDALAWPFKVTGIVLGGLGVAMTIGSDQEDDVYNQHNVNVRERQQFVGGLVLTAIGAGLTYSGIAMSSKERVNNDIYYPGELYRYVTIDESQVVNYKKRVMNH